MNRPYERKTCVSDVTNRIFFFHNIYKLDIKEDRRKGRKEDEEGGEKEGKELEGKEGKEEGRKGRKVRKDSGETGLRGGRKKGRGTGLLENG